MTVLSWAKDVGAKALAVLFPPFCLACSCVEGTESLPLGLCGRCRERLEPAVPRSPRGDGRGDSHLIRVISRWSYEPPLDRVVQALKFGHLEFLGRDLADGLHPLVQEHVAEIDVIVPVPLHWLRLRRRGFNQAEAIAEPLAARLGMPLVRALRRRRSTAAQTHLGRMQRRENLKQAFACKAWSRSGLRGRRVLLVDDVITTGATLEEAARCLLGAGAHSVAGATAARTPRSARLPSMQQREPLWKGTLTPLQ